MKLYLFLCKSANKCFNQSINPHHHTDLEVAAIDVHGTDGVLFCRVGHLPLMIVIFCPVDHLLLIVKVQSLCHVQVSVTMTTMRMNDREGKPNEQYLYLM